MINGFGELIASVLKSRLCQVAGIDGVVNWMASWEWVAM